MPNLLHDGPARRRPDRGDAHGLVTLRDAKSMTY
jgi:hypothetical protein